MTSPRPVVRIVGPTMAGVTCLARALAERMPEADVVEARDAGEGLQPVAGVVVFAVSAAAPMVDSDCALLEEMVERAAAAQPLVAVVTKIDAHRRWRQVLAADRAALAARAPRFRGARWLGVAAAPDLGVP